MVSVMITTESLGELETLSDVFMTRVSRAHVFLLFLLELLYPNMKNTYFLIEEKKDMVLTCYNPATVLSDCSYKLT